MRFRYPGAVLAIVCGVLGVSHAQLPARKPVDPTPWNGTWRLSVPRSSPVAAEAGVPRSVPVYVGTRKQRRRSD